VDLLEFKQKRGGEKIMNKKTMLLTVALVAISAMALTGAKVAKADEENNYPPIVQRLVEKFKLDENEVRSVFDQDREEHRTQMQARFSENLDQAVSEGKISAEQKEAILKKHEEMQAENESLRDLAPEERREKMQEKRSELENWAQENGLEVSDFFGLGLGRGQGGRMGKGMGMGMHRDF
jgi:molecular chaperone DnaK (HSP70)